LHVSIPASAPYATVSSPLACYVPKPESYIPASQTLNALNAFEFAARMGKTPNTYIVVTFPAFRNWVAGSGSAEQHRKFREQTIKSVYDWHMRKSLEQVCIHVDENPSKGGPGPHINILLHLPVADWHELRGSLFVCLRKTAGVSTVDCPDGNRTSAKRKAIHALPHDTQHPMDYDNALRVLQYILKGADPGIQVLNHNRMLVSLSEIPNIRLEPQGDVRSQRRVGVSETISQEARKRDSNWKDAKTLDLLWKNRSGKKPGSAMPPLPIDIDIKALQEATGGTGDEDAQVVPGMANSPYNDPNDPEWGSWS